MDCSYWSPFGVSPVPISTYFVFGPWTRWTWGEIFGQNLLSSWSLISSFTIFPLPPMLLLMLLAIILVMAVAYFFRRQTLPSDSYCAPIGMFVARSCMNTFPTLIIIALRSSMGVACLEKYQAAPTRIGKGNDRWFFCLLIWELHCLLSPFLSVSHHVADSQ